MTEENMSEKSEEKKYFVTYDVTPHPEGLTDEEVPDGRGAASNLIVISIMGTPAEGGPLSVLVLSKGRDGQEMSAIGQFVVWTMWAYRLVEVLPDTWHRSIVMGVLDAMAMVMKAAAKKQREME